MNIEEKYKLAFEIASKEDFPKDKETVLSIAECIKNERFLYELSNGEIVLFLTWEDNLIDNKRYIFVNNCWINSNYRSPKNLLKIRGALKYLLRNVYKFYWFNRQKQKMIYRR